MRVVTQGRRGLFSLFLSLLLAALPCLAADGRNALLALAGWAVGSGVRWYNQDPQVTTDCYIFCVLKIWVWRKKILGLGLTEWEEAGGAGMVASSPLHLASAVTVPLALLGVYIWRALGNKKISTEEPPPGFRKWIGDCPKALIFPCQTTHARMFPKRHAFGYSYLQCGYPIIPSGTTSAGVDIGLGEDQELGCWWLRVRAVDYLERGNGEIGFYNKLKLYLRAQHVEDVDWSHAYLLTAPRFFGYAFNPVSFYYIYNQDNQLKNMILEVNNTFGERRMYLLDGSSPLSPPQAHEPEIPGGVKSRFTDIWTKDFHVSPFNSRKGSYSLKAVNPFPYVSYDAPTIDNTITLQSSKDHAKLVARLHSTGKALDPSQLSLFGTLRFILSWWWVGFVTSPRILKEAAKLFFKRKLHVWFRPEVSGSSIGRLPTASETVIYQVFRDYLFQLVHQPEHTFHITLKPAIPDIPSQLILSTHNPGRLGRTYQELEICVLTPAFYSRLVHYTQISEAFDRECLFTDERNRTLWICRPQVLLLLFSKKCFVKTEDRSAPMVERSCFDELRWRFMRWLRCPPADPAYSVTPLSSEYSVDDIRSQPYSELDNFVRQCRDRHYAGEYRRVATKLFLAQRFCFGFTEVVSIADLFIRVFFCYLAASQIALWDGEAIRLMLSHFTEKDGMDLFSGEIAQAWRWLATPTFATISCHMYGQVLKGYN